MGWKIHFYLMMLSGVWLQYLLFSTDEQRKNLKERLWKKYGGIKPRE